MKKIIASAVGLMLAGGIVATTASAAVESQFGGYWRNRFILQENIDGKDSGSTFIIDQRGRLFFTAKFSDDFKFVNKFEWNSAWGDAATAGQKAAGLGSGGDIGADGKTDFRIKNSYADFNVGPMFNAKLGITAAVVARGFIFDDDFSGAIVTGKFGNVTVPLVYIRAASEDAGELMGMPASSDTDIFAALATVKISDAISVTPYFVFHTVSVEDTDNWYAGVDADMKMGSVSLWGTGIYNGGKLKGADNAGFLAAVGVDAGIAHGQAFYATGDDNAADGENDAFVSAPGSYYAWAEIMGDGIFDNKNSAGSFGTDISNAMAFNAGVTVKPMDKLKVGADVWYAALAEDNAAGDNDLGIELDANVAYSIYDNLTAEYVFAYLISGDATGKEDVIETGVRFSLKF